MTLPLKWWGPVMTCLKLNKEVNVAFSGWAQGLFSEIEKFRRVSIGIWKNYHYMKEEEELLLIYGI